MENKGRAHRNENDTHQPQTQKLSPILLKNDTIIV